MMQVTHDVDRQERMQQAGQLFAEAGQLLASSLDYEETLAGVAELAVRSLADFCVIDVVEDGEVRRLQAAHADPDRAELTRELLRFPLDRRRPHLSLEALDTGRSVLVPEVSDADLEAKSQGTEHRRILEALRPRSLMAVPLHARDRVLGIVAHDLRNPMNAILMSAQLLLDDTFSDLQRGQQAQLILRAGTRMNRLIQDLLDVARIEADQLVLHREIQEPEALAHESVETSAATAAAKSLSIGICLAEDLPSVSADRDRLLQVLSNLIGNAVKFTPEGGTVEVRVEPGEGAVHFSVADTGPGIPPENLPRLFQPFWQAQRGSLDGAGLGLMIARGIVEAHGGRIWAESAPGRGSTFHFTIPAMSPPLQGERRHGLADRCALAAAF